MLKRKITDTLLEWKDRKDHKPLIVQGARQVGKSVAIEDFGRRFFKSCIVINFALQKQFLDIFDDGYDVDKIISNISFKLPEAKFIPGDTLIFFDEIQALPNCATSLKSFHIDGRYQVICSGSLMGMHYKEIESNSVGFKEDITLYSMDFEEFLWAKGYVREMIDKLYAKMLNVEPLTSSEMKAMMDAFHEYMVVGGMPEVVNMFVTQKNYDGILAKQRQLHRDYDDDIVKYAIGLDKAKIQNIYHHIPAFLAKENKKFQITKVARNARNRDYIGTTDWLAEAGVVNICHNMDTLELPLQGNYLADNYKLYFSDTGFLIASLEDEAQDDLRLFKNYGTYKGAIYENICAQILVQQGYSLYFYRNEKSTIEMDFIIRDAHGIIPVEVKANDGATASLNNLINSDSYPMVKYGVKFGNKNIGFNGKFYTFPYSLTFLLKRFLGERALALDKR